ncbi:hypothetical protein PENSPDRAFT_758902 [Peniophora sp. CONT]|nr:hypothetical protein PENSPDRAFT_758902 [Peniophora sp. CONT]
MSTPTKKSPAIWEVMSFPANSAYLKDPSLFQPVVDTIGKHSPHDIYTGLQIEEPTNQVTAFIGWDSVEQHIAFTKGSAFARLAPHVAACTKNEPEVRHVFFHGDGEELLALRAPVTELAWMTPKPGIDEAEFQQAVKLGTELFHKDERCLGAAWGMVVEPESLKNMAVYVAGWNSKEEREDTVEALFDKMHATSVGVRGVDGKQAKSYDEISDLTLAHLKLRPGRTV